MSWHLVTSVPTTFQNHSPSRIQGPAGSEDLWIPAELCSFQDSNICRKMPKPQNSAPRIIAGRGNALSPPWETKRKIRRTRTRTTCGKWDKTKYIDTHTRAIPNSRLSPQRQERRAFSGICSETFQSGRWIMLTEASQDFGSPASRNGNMCCSSEQSKFFFVRCIN